MAQLFCVARVLPMVGQEEVIVQAHEAATIQVSGGTGGGGMVKLAIAALFMKSSPRN